MPNEENTTCWKKLRLLLIVLNSLLSNHFYALFINHIDSWKFYYLRILVRLIRTSVVSKNIYFHRAACHGKFYWFLN